ncbi:LVIVD repeat-containing protein [Hymenobacter crusticola]|uniref:LVIVD repeat-containing protein n=1 Tax=Hymenobacter crusticola TaxID=1770526 RepID=A0A243W9L9_9BACT|nr:hypothetical protein [Hymenobacter crusticola]OUJ72223.1 hypothetical protein BXP70_19790 [Hymenobacter crusticola]
MKRVVTYLFGWALLLGMTACAESDESEPNPSPSFVRSSYYGEYSYCPSLVSRTTLEQSVASIPARAMHNTGKIYLLGNYLFINERYEGIHVIDNQDPKHPRAISFLRIPGNIDMAVKGNLLYADNGPDLVTIDISNPQDVRLASRVRNAFPELPMPADYYLNSACAEYNRPANTIVVGWQKIKNNASTASSGPIWLFDSRNIFTLNSASGAAYNSAPNPTGKGGSMARFAVLGQSLYTVDNNSLRLFDLTDPAHPAAGVKIPLSFGVETIYPKDHYLFLGSQRGMYIFDVATPQAPKQLSYIQHFMSCDPVVVDDRYAYVTLRSGRACGGATINELQVIDLANLSQPRIARTYPMTGPQGLGVDNNLLFVCDSDGLKIFDTSQSPMLTQKQQFSVNVVDVIPNQGVLMAIGADGLYQYSYTGTELKQLSKLSISRAD